MNATSFVSDEQRQGGTFYCCDYVNGCGLRFPVAMSDAFNGLCPRCGGSLRAVAQVGVGNPAVSSVFTAQSSPSSNIHLLLDNWRSLFNVGAAFRSADGAGVRHLYLCGITGTPDAQRKLAKTALGAERAVAWSYHADAVRLASELKQEGAQLWVLESYVQAVSLFDITTVSGNVPLILAAGNEVVGVDPGLLALADKVIQLPMVGSKRSLNVAAALSIATYWLRAQELATMEANRASG